MKIIDRYLIQEFLKPFCYTLVAAILIYLTAELFEKIDILIDNKVSFKISVNFFLYGIPKIIVDILPLTCLIATLLTFTRLARQNELVILKVSGINIVRGIYPVLFFSLIIGIFTLIFNETIVPNSNAKVKEIKEKDIYKRQLIYEGIKQDISYYDQTGKMFFIKLLDPPKGIVNGLTVYEFDEDYRLRKRIDVTEAKWLGKFWILKEGFSRTFGEKEEAVSLKMEKMYIPETPQDFSRQQKDPIEMSFFDLRNYVRKMRNSGLEFKREMIELYTKISYPFTCFFIVLLGIPFAIKTGRKGTFVLSIGISLLFGFSYWGIIALCKALGRSGVLNPILSAWGANILAGTVSLVMFRWTEK